MDWPEMIKCNDLRSFEKQIADALVLLDDKIKCYTISLNKKKQAQHLKEQLRQSVEARAENIRRLEAKKSPIKQQIERIKTRIAQLNDEISEFIIESERLKFKNLSLGKEVEECRKELKKANEIHLKAMEHYKRKLYVRLEMDDKEKLILHFTDIEASVILTCVQDEVYQLIATEPELKCLNKLVEMLETTHDISGCLGHIRALLQKKYKQHIKEAN